MKTKFNIESSEKMNIFILELSKLLTEHDVSIVRVNDGVSISISMSHSNCFEDAYFDEEISPCSGSIELNECIKKLTLIEY